MMVASALTCRLPSEVRRRSRRRGGALLALLAASACGAPAPGAEALRPGEQALEVGARVETNWSQAWRSPRRTAYDPFESQLSARTVSDLQVLWQTITAAAGGDARPQLLAQKGERLFVNTHRVGTGALLALDTATGVLLWESPFSDYFYGTPTYARGLVFAANVDALLGLRASSGSIVARAGVPAFDYTVSELLATGDQIVAVVRGHEDWNEAAELHVVDAVTGEASAGGGVLSALGVEVVVPPAAANGTWFVVGSGQVIALDAVDASVVWRTRGLQAAGPHEWPVPGPVRQGPAVIDGRVFVASSGQVAALAERDGRVLWSARTAGGAVGHVAVTHEHVYVPSQCSGEANPFVTIEAFDVSSGARCAVHRVDGCQSGDLALAGDLLFMGQDDGSLYALELETLRRLARFELGGTLGAAAIARGQLYVANETTVFALGLPDGA